MSRYISTNIGIIRDPGHAEPWICRAMSAKPGYLTTLDYAKRWGIEPMFSDFKSRGFGIEQTQIQYPNRVARLILVMALALHWAVSTGMWDAVQNPSPAEKSRQTPAPQSRQKQALLVHQGTAKAHEAPAEGAAVTKTLGLARK
ncbi:transposase [Acidiphilium iwatense]|uniref:Transposase n=1 Tax=Acidiphilium iwatense TaxID=768198 RepID=A0ABS9E1Z1_9PROT|nr:transposase [Acidiphilium iwatense]MCF3948973.1 transposase [Acidiphilium iwatense]